MPSLTNIISPPPPSTTQTSSSTPSSTTTSPLLAWIGGFSNKSNSSINKKQQQQELPDRVVTTTTNNISTTTTTNNNNCNSQSSNLSSSSIVLTPTNTTNNNNSSSSSLNDYFTDDVSSDQANGDDDDSSLTSNSSLISNNNNNSSSTIGNWFNQLWLRNNSNSNTTPTTTSSSSSLTTPPLPTTTPTTTTTPFSSTINNVISSVNNTTTIKTMKNVNTNIRSFVSSTLKSALSLTSSSSKGIMTITTNDPNDDEPPTTPPLTTTSKETASSSPPLIQLSLLNNNLSIEHYSETILSPLFYNDELLPINQYKQFLLDYSHKLNTFLTRYFKMEQPTSTNNTNNNSSIVFHSKNLIQLYDLCLLIIKGESNNTLQQNSQANSGNSSSVVENCLQKYIFEIIAVDGTFNIHYEKDALLYKKLKLFQNVLEPKHLSLPNNFLDLLKNKKQLSVQSSPSVQSVGIGGGVQSTTTAELLWNESIHLLRKLNQYKTPYGKIFIIEKIFKNISSICSSIVDPAFSSDHLLSCLIYLVLKACPHNLNSDMWFLVTFCLDHGIYKSDLHGSELDFILTSLYCALEFWENVPLYFNDSNNTNTTTASTTTNTPQQQQNTNVVSNSNSSSNNSDEKIFQSFIVQDEKERIKFRRAFKVARRKTQRLERIITTDDDYYTTQSDDNLMVEDGSDVQHK